MSSVVIDGSSFRSALFDLEGEIYRAAGQAIEDGVDAAAKDAFSSTAYRNKTWTLRSSTRATVNKFAFSGRLENKTRYASHIEFGTKPHVIRARRVPYLRFYWTRVGSWFVGKSVNHPGTKGRFFFKHAGQVGEAKILSTMQHRVDQSTSRFNRAA